MTKEYCRISIDEASYQNWLCEDENLDELWVMEQEAQHDSQKADKEE